MVVSKIWTSAISYWFNIFYEITQFVSVDAMYNITSHHMYNYSLQVQIPRVTLQELTQLISSEKLIPKRVLTSSLDFYAHSVRNFS